MPGAVRRFGKKKVYIGGLLIWVLGDLLNYFFGGGSVSFVAFSCLAFFGSAFVNSLNWALVSDTVSTASGARACVRKARSTPASPSSQSVSGAGWFLPRLDADANWLCAEHRTADHTIEGLRQLIFHLPKRTGGSHHCGDGLLLQPEREDVCPHCGRDRSP